MTSLPADYSRTDYQIAAVYADTAPTYLEDLEADHDARPASRGTYGSTRRPQALRQARARRTALLRRF